MEGKEGQDLDSLRAFPKGFTEYGVNGMPEVTLTFGSVTFCPLMVLDVILISILIHTKYKIIQVAELCRDRGLGPLFDTLFKRYPKQGTQQSNLQARLCRTYNTLYLLTRSLFYIRTI